MLMRMTAILPSADRCCSKAHPEADRQLQPPSAPECGPPKPLAGMPEADEPPRLDGSRHGNHRLLRSQHGGLPIPPSPPPPLPGFSLHVQKPLPCVWLLCIYFHVRLTTNPQSLKCMDGACSRWLRNTTMRRCFWQCNQIACMTSLYRTDHHDSGIW